jgi:16S rRNA (cytidine1402-2'-O)-methyltransferase
VRGEMVLLLAPAASVGAAGGTESRPGIAAAVAELVKTQGISEMDALKRVARERGLGKSEAYRELQREQRRR